MNGRGSGNLDHFFARFHDLIGERNHFFLRERERELNHFLRELPIPWTNHIANTSTVRLFLLDIEMEFNEA